MAKKIRVVGKDVLPVRLKILLPIFIICFLWLSCQSGWRRTGQPSEHDCKSQCTRFENVSEKSLRAIAVQGDRPRGLVLAHQFVNGCDSQGQPVLGRLSVPSSWRARHLHCDDGIKHQNFFIDKENTHGDDLNQSFGLENAQLIFYSGHGRLRSWQALGDRYTSSVWLEEFSLGDYLVRYLWMISCNVMGHGPLDAASDDYVSPEQFNPNAAATSGASDRHVDAFRRWSSPDGSDQKAALHPNLRIACGGSSLIGGGSYPGGLIWHLLMASENLPIADAFTLALADKNAVPLCLARGEESWWRTPLRDTDFTGQENEWANGGFLHAQYPIRHEIDIKQVASVFGSLFSTSWNTFDDLVGPIAPRPGSPCEKEPCRAPILILKKASQTSPLPGLEGLYREGLPPLNYGFVGGTAELIPNSGLFRILTESGVEPKSVRIKRHPGSGAVVLGGALTDTEGRSVSIPVEAFVTLGLLDLRPLDFETLRQATSGGLFESSEYRSSWGYPGFEDIDLEIQRVPEEKAAAGKLTEYDVLRRTKEHLLRIQLSRRISGIKGDIPVFGPGGQWLIRFTPKLDGIIGFSYIARELDARNGIRFGLIKTQSEAIREARQQLGESSSEYNLHGNIRWGYRAAEYHCVQPEMYLVYQLDFVARNPEWRIDFPPVTVEVPAHRVEKSPECAPE